MKYFRTKRILSYLSIGLTLAFFHASYENPSKMFIRSPVGVKPTRSEKSMTCKIASCGASADRCTNRKKCACGTFVSESEFPAVAAAETLVSEKARHTQCSMHSNSRA